MRTILILALSLTGCATQTQQPKPPVAVRRDEPVTRKTLQAGLASLPGPASEHEIRFAKESWLRIRPGHRLNGPERSVWDYDYSPAVLTIESTSLPIVEQTGKTWIIRFQETSK